MRRASALRPLPPRLLAVLGAALLLAGTVEVHPAEAHAEVIGGEELVYTCATDPGGALHVEAARAAQREQCPGCLHRIRSAAADAPAPAMLADRLGSRPLPTAADPALSPAHHRHQRARAPPVLS